MLKDPLLGIGAIVIADIVNEKEAVMIIGKRQLNKDSGNCWDYNGVPYPGGYNRRAEFVYFNHGDIHEVLMEASAVTVPDEEEAVLDDLEDED